MVASCTVTCTAQSVLNLKILTTKLGESKLHIFGGANSGRIEFECLFNFQILLQLWKKFKSGCNLLFSGFWKIILDILSPNENFEGMTVLLLESRMYRAKTQQT